MKKRSDDRKKIEVRYSAYKHNAKAFVRDFDLSLREFKNLIKEPCYICGGNDKPNGVDRVDNNLGYTNENSRSCCKICNRMKMDLDINDLIDHIIKIVAYNHIDQRYLPKNNGIRLIEIDNRSFF
jgi:hypothetical protein